MHPVEAANSGGTEIPGPAALDQYQYHLNSLLLAEESNLELVLLRHASKIQPYLLHT